MNTPPGGPLHELVQCLQDEYQALLDEDLPRLERALAAKQDLLAALAGAMGNPAAGARRAALSTRLALARVRALNERNALVLAPRSAGNRARLQFLQAALGRNPLYGADGTVHSRA